MFYQRCWVFNCEMGKKASCLQVERLKRKTRFLSIMLLAPRGQWERYKIKQWKTF